MDCYEPQHKKAGLWGFQPGSAQTSLYSHRNRLGACDFVFKKKRECTIPVHRLNKAVPLFSLRQKSGLLVTRLILYSDIL